MLSAHTQRGMSAVGFIIVLALIGTFVLVTLKLFPAYMESFKVTAAMESLASQPGIGDKGKGEVIDMLMKRLDVDDVDNVKPGDIDVRPRDGGGLLLGVKYETRGTLFSNLDFVVRFDKSVELR